MYSLPIGWRSQRVISLIARLGQSHSFCSAFHLSRDCFVASISLHWQLNIFSIYFVLLTKEVSNCSVLNPWITQLIAADRLEEDWIWFTSTDSSWAQKNFFSKPTLKWKVQERIAMLMMSYNEQSHGCMGSTTLNKIPVPAKYFLY